MSNLHILLAGRALFPAHCATKGQLARIFKHFFNRDKWDGVKSRWIGRSFAALRRDFLNRYLLFNLHRYWTVLVAAKGHDQTATCSVERTSADLSHVA